MDLEQACFARSSTAIVLKSQTAGFSEAWRTEAERMIVGFGDISADITLGDAGHCMFVQPFVRRWIAVVRVDCDGVLESGRSYHLLFRFFILPQALYYRLGGDPFHLLDQLVPPASGVAAVTSLDNLAPAPYRTVGDLKKVLDVPHSATLLGGVQALLDGGRLVFERAAPDAALMRSLWSLLPTSSRAELWPATFALGNVLSFHALVVPKVERKAYPYALTEEQAGDYPEGRYEYSLQHAIELADQPELDRLLSRRSRMQMIRLALILLAAFILIPLLVALIPGR